MAKGPHPLLCPDLRTARVKLRVSGTRYRLNYCVIVVLCTRFTNATASRGLHTHDLNVRVISYSVNA